MPKLLLTSTAIVISCILLLPLVLIVVVARLEKAIILTKARHYFSLSCNKVVVDIFKR